MQKKLIALAIAGLASTGAFAQSNVTIYGVMDASIDVTDTGDTTAGVSGTRTNKISSNSSRIGFKGSEDLGGGLKAVFQIETGINADGEDGTAATGAAVQTSNASRNTFVGLAGDSWGQVLLGRYDTPYKTSTRGLDVFGDYLADNRNLMGKGTVGFDGRAANTVRYDSAAINGFKFAAAYVAGAEAATLDTNDKGNAFSLSGSYAITSALNAAVAYERHNFGTAGTGTIATGTGNVSEKAWKLGLGYKEGAIRAGFVYEKTSNDFAAAAAAEEYKAWTLAGGYTIGSNEIKASYTLADDKEGVADSGAKQWAIGVDHLMSKRTKLYALYVKLDNDSAATYALTGAGATGGVANLGAGADPSGFQLGVRHTF